MLFAHSTKKDLKECVTTAESSVHQCVVGTALKKEPSLTTALIYQTTTIGRAIALGSSQDFERLAKPFDVAYLVVKEDMSSSMYPILLKLKR